MNKLSVSRSMGVGFAAFGLTGAMMSFAPAAFGATAVSDVTVVGSNTTQDLIGAYATQFNGTTAGQTVHVTNIPAQPADPGVTAPSDKYCNGGSPITYVSENPPPQGDRTAPNGSTAGRAALAASVANGDSCVSVARSSSPPSSTGTDPAGTKAYAFATDAVTWSAVAPSAGGDAPASLNLTMPQLAAIYSCTITNWDQVGGANAPIIPFYPQAGSGTGSFFAGVLGTNPQTNGCVPASNLIEENETTAIPGSEVNQAIMIFSGGSYASQVDGNQPNRTNGFSLGSINGYKVLKGSGTSVTLNPVVAAEKNVEPTSQPYNPSSTTQVQGVRNLYNFVNSNSKDYEAAVDFAGPGSPLCTGKEKSLIAKYGFIGLQKCLYVASK